MDSFTKTDRSYAKNAFGAYLGPILSAHQKDMGPWQHNIELLLRGIYPSQYPGSVVYRPWSVVDVRDCAAGHVGLLESVTVKSGERYVCENDEFCIKNEKLWIEHEGLCITNDEFCRSPGSPSSSRSSTSPTVLQRCSRSSGDFCRNEDSSRKRLKILQ